MSRKFPLAIVLILGFFLTTSASATTYYIAANGTDSNNGTSNSTPWLHAPGMTGCSGTCASTKPQAGDRFIFRGGDKWHRSASTSGASDAAMGGGWTWSASGSSGSTIYIGVDQSWYNSATCGSSWCKPIISMDNPLSTSFPSACSYNDDGLNAIAINAGYVQFDNFELSGWCLNSSGGSLVPLNSSGNRLLSNLYFHGWTLTTHASDDSYHLISDGERGGTDIFDHIVMDGSDSSAGAVCTNSSCVASTWGGSGTPSPIPATGWGMSGTCYLVRYSVFRHMSNAMQCNPTIIHDSLFEYDFEPGYGRHGNVVEAFGGTTNGSTMYFYNNIVRNVNEGETLNLEGNTINLFNNIVENDQHFAPDPNCFLLAPNGASSGSVVGTVNFYNNTVDNTCAMEAFGGNANGPGYASGSTFNFRSNHVIGRTSIFSGFFSCGSGSSCTNKNDLGNEVFQTLSAANSQGYTLANNFQPTSQSAATVGRGADSATECATFSTDLALCSGTSDGAMEGAGGKAVSPVIPIVQRLATWDAGAYQYGGGTGASGPPNPPSGLVASVQ